MTSQVSIGDIIGALERHSVGIVMDPHIFCLLESLRVMNASRRRLLGSSRLQVQCKVMECVEELHWVTGGDVSDAGSRQGSSPKLRAAEQ